MNNNSFEDFMKTYNESVVLKFKEVLNEITIYKGDGEFLYL